MLVPDRGRMFWSFGMVFIILLNCSLTKMTTAHTLGHSYATHLPGMGGGEAYDRLNKANIEVKVLLSIGYSINDQAKV